jgi:hypothetical protein
MNNKEQKCVGEVRHDSITGDRLSPQCKNCGTYFADINNPPICHYVNPTEGNRRCRFCHEMSIAVAQARQGEEEKWRKILNSGRKMYELGQSEMREKLYKEIEALPHYLATVGFKEDIVMRKDLLSLIKNSE